MIKFVCANCGERLSVPDTQGGRRGICPICQAVSRIPLRGFAETRPDSPVVAKLVGNVPLKALGDGDVFSRELAQPTPTEFGRVVEPEEIAPPIPPAAAPAAPAVSPSALPERAGVDTAATSVAPSPQAESPSAIEPLPTRPIPGNNTQPGFIAPVPAAARSSRHVKLRPIMPDETGRYRPAGAHGDWRLPMALRMFMLILVVALIVGSLYSGLFWIVRSLKAVP